MLQIRRSFTKLPSSVQQNTSVGKFLRTTNKSCPYRNTILGEHFCRFAVRSKLYIDAVNSQKIFNSNLLHNQCENAISKLDLKEASIDGTSQIKLLSTGQFLSASIQKSLNKWKQCAHDEVGNAYSKNQNRSDEFISGMVRGINYSLIGWYLQTYGMQNAFAFIQWLGVPLFSDSEKLSMPKLASPLFKQNNHETQQKLNHLLNGYSTLEGKIKYSFHDKAYLLQSVTHESFGANDLTSNYHGLDFVGDAILNYAIVRHLFRQPMNLNADDLYNLSTLLYCNSNLAMVSVRNGLHKYLRYTAPDVRDNINSFVAFLQRNKFKTIDDIHFLDKKNFVFEVPSIISSSFEALIGAIYFDSLMDLNTVSNTISHLMRFDIRNICENKPCTAYDKLRQLDDKAWFSEPVTVASGQIKVTVTLPKFNNKSFSAFSRDPLLAKWGAAKAAVIQLQNQENAFIPQKHKDMLQQFKHMQ